MLANPHHSRLILINPAKEPGGTPAGLLARRHESLSLLRSALEICGIALNVVGEYQPGQIPMGLDEIASTIDRDVLSLWSDPEFARSLGASDVGAIFLAGAWLEEDVLVAALQGIKLGYDVRVLADLSVARIEADRSLAVDRLSLHGVPAMTVRQALLEWATYLEDPIQRQRVQQLLA
jgi:hypothetical protein